MNKSANRIGPVAFNQWLSVLIYFLLFALLTNCKRSTEPDVIEPSTQVGGLTVGEFKEGVSQEVSTRGGAVQISDPASPLNGFKLEVPSGAYAQSRTFNVSYAPVQKHSFGPDFTSLSPLIHLDNQGGYAQQMMTLSIPIKVPANHFAAVVALRADNKVEVLPILSVTNTQIVVTLAHMDYASTSAKNGRSAVAQGMDISVFSTEEKNLGNVESATGFTPGVDDWEFTNYGTYASGGNCSGMSRTALWYFLNKKETEGSLYSNPNFGDSTTNSKNINRNKYWMVNSLGLKWVSMVQQKKLMMFIF